MPPLPSLSTRGGIVGVAAFGVEFDAAVLAVPIRLVVILVLAIVVNRLARRSVGRFSRRMKGEIAGGGVAGRRRRRRSDGTEAVTAPSVATLRAAQRAETIGTLLKSVVSLTIGVFTVLTILGEVGINLGPLIAGAGFVGVALGFGAQNLVRDFLSGIFMLIEDQYGVGDIIDAGEASGTVEAVSLRTTRLRDVYGVVWHIPNGQIQRIGNKSQNWSRALLDVSVGYGSDLARATEVIEQTAHRLKADPLFAVDIIEEPEVWGVEDLGADGITIRLAVKTAPAAQFRVARELRARLKAALDEAGIEIPFPQRVIWHRAEDGNGAAVGPVINASSPAQPASAPTTKAAPRRRRSSPPS